MLRTGLDCKTMSTKDWLNYLHDRIRHSFLTRTRNAGLAEEGAGNGEAGELDGRQVWLSRG